MDEVEEPLINSNSASQASLSSTDIQSTISNIEDSTIVAATERRLCIVGDTIKNNVQIIEAAKTFGYPVIFSSTGEEYSTDDQCVFVLEHLMGEVYDKLQSERCVLGPVVLLECSRMSQSLPTLAPAKPLHCLSMRGFKICFSGFKKSRKEELSVMIKRIIRMGGSVRRDVSEQVTHLIASSCSGEMYRYAVCLGLSVMSQSWIDAMWEKRDCLMEQEEKDELMKLHHLPPFTGCKVCLVGFADEERQRMESILVASGGAVASEDSCTHLVLEDGPPPSASNNCHLVRSEWFWATVQMDACADEALYPIKMPDSVSPQKTGSPFLQSTPSSRKRKRLKDTLVSQLAQDPFFSVHTNQVSPPTNRRRDSLDPIPDVEGDGVECEISTPRHQRFLELLHTEGNYVGVLKTIMELFHEPLEAPSQVGGALLDPTELKIIFGHLPPIYQVHKAMLKALRDAKAHWTDHTSIGNIIIERSPDLLKAYPPFVNFFEKTKEMLVKCDEEKPRFHAFLKIVQGKEQCGRQTLQEMLIRPVQRLPSICLLINDLLQHSPNNNPDHVALEKALSRIKEVMTHINEDKRKTEGQIALFDILYDIENCPPHLLSSHRNFISRCEVTDLTGNLCGRGEHIVIFLFSDVMELCKRRGRGSIRSPSMGTLPPASRIPSKHYKHVEMLLLSNIKRVVDIRETEECRKVFALVCRSSHELRERLHSFAIINQDTNKDIFLRTLCRQMANTVCRADAENFLTCLDAHQLDIETSDVRSSTLSKAASRFATCTRQMVGRALSLRRTPSKLKRAVSQMISPLAEEPIRMGSCQSLIDESRRSSNAHAIPSTPQLARTIKRV